MTGLRYVYAVCRPLDAPLQTALTGVAGDPPRLLTHHGLIAVVSHVPERDFAEEPLRRRSEDPDWLTATARAHEQVIDALTAVTTPLPLRLATVFRDDSGVRVMMEEREEEFRRTLGRLAGRVEWRVKAYAEAESEAESESGAEQFADRLHLKLAAHADSARLHPSAKAPGTAFGRNVLNAAYLVPRADSEEFVEIVQRAKNAESRMRVELSGPWAAYSFVEAGEGSPRP
ncbi:GvpL/GvpF family gas vesicle protein [Streptomyces sp. NBC_01275]|uniref:GvpL/GvpF family gas vesicle protein n=1 Tax=Streptomyces sp. NBC_01275 TaxID=2903807 RepID=UPI002254C6A0|nr:GvpL/GvpF family gas vesicle protein [Streptomyces sp. NBC_01275]MCX4766195.1 GvpL/GvpF family gas vesicle protein [Streptomyces sp. NBC_01275]